VRPFRIRRLEAGDARMERRQHCAFVIPFVRSVIETFEYERLISVAFWPFGQVSVVDGGVTVKVPVTNPFLTLKVPVVP
jgi:hypothetical protein